MEQISASRNRGQKMCAGSVKEITEHFQSGKLNSLRPNEFIALEAKVNIETPHFYSSRARKDVMFQQGKSPNKAKQQIEIARSPIFKTSQILRSKSFESQTDKVLFSQ